MTAIAPPATRPTRWRRSGHISIWTGERNDASLAAAVAAGDESALKTAYRKFGGAVRRAVAGLSDGEREAISLAIFRGLTYVEVAKHLDQPEGTVKSRIRSGMRKLSETLPDMVS